MRPGRGALAEQRKEAMRDPARRFLMLALWAAFDGDEQKAAAGAVIAWLVWPHVTARYAYFDHFEFERIEKQQGRGMRWCTFTIGDPSSYRELP